MRGKTFTTAMTIALALVLVLGVLTPVSQSSNEMGTSPEPRAIFQIFDVNDLQDMQNHLTDDCVLMNDIDATITSTWNGGEGFEPVGDLFTWFTGSLDGQNYTITGLYINRTVDCVGLFGWMGAGSSVKNLSLSGIEISGAEGVGGFAGYNDGGTITNCYSRGNTSGSNGVGGFLGYNYVGTITNCYSTGNTVGDWWYVGGFAGFNYLSGTITNCSSTGSASGYASIGGFAGHNDGTITNCYSTGNASGTAYVGGFAGRNGGTITNCYCIGNASGTGNDVGGFAGYNYASGTITNCYSIGNASGVGGFVGGFAGRNDGGSIADCFWDNQTSGRTTSDGGTGKTTEEMMQQATFTNWDFTTIWGIIEYYTYPYFQPRDMNFRLSVKLPLLEGWNLLSIPITQSSESLDDILESIDGKWDCIQIYDCLDPKPWKTNATFRPDQLNDFNTLNHKMGFWINITEANVNLTLYGGVATSTSIPLYAGWNLVGYPTLANETVANALWGTGADKVEVFDPAEPYRIREVGPTYVMRSGEGYWVHVPADTVWTIDW